MAAKSSAWDLINKCKYRNNTLIYKYIQLQDIHLHHMSQPLQWEMVANSYKLISLSIAEWWNVVIYVIDWRFEIETKCSQSLYIQAIFGVACGSVHLLYSNNYVQMLPPSPLSTHAEYYLYEYTATHRYKNFFCLLQNGNPWPSELLHQLDPGGVVHGGRRMGPEQGREAAAVWKRWTGRAVAQLNVDTQNGINEIFIIEHYTYLLIR